MRTFFSFSFTLLFALAILPGCSDPWEGDCTGFVPTTVLSHSIAGHFFADCKGYVNGEELPEDIRYELTVSPMDANAVSIGFSRMDQVEGQAYPWKSSKLFRLDNVGLSGEPYNVAMNGSGKAFFGDYDSEVSRITVTGNVVQPEVMSRCSPWEPAVYNCDITITVYTPDADQYVYKITEYGYGWY